MQGKKILFLFLALLLPICVFLFLKIFGKNEFQVKPLYQDVLPEMSITCLPVQLPYKINSDILKKAVMAGDTLGLIYFESSSPVKASQNQMTRIKEEFVNDPLTITTIDFDSASDNLRRCVFFLKEPYDVVLVDHAGTIRGQYILSDREEIDRLITEIDIILKKY